MLAQSREASFPRLLDLPISALQDGMITNALCPSEHIRERKKSMKHTAMFVTALSGALYLASGIISPASAAIQCKGNLQYNSAVNGWIESSYCGDNLITSVARSHGMKVSNREVRLNPSTKEEACRFAGSDIRIQDLCAGDLPGDQNGSSRP